MKKFFAILLSCLLLLTAGCTAKPKATENTQTELFAPAEFRICSLKGPTSMGLAGLLDDSEADNTYEANIVTGADEVTAALVSGKADIAMLPANAAATLYQKAGGFKVVAVNTLGVLYVVENGDTVHSLEDLAGKTVCLTGKGTTPEYALRDLLAAHGMDDKVTLEFKSEPAEVISAMTSETAVIGLLPQPFVTSAQIQNEKLRIALDLTEEWSNSFPGSQMVTSVTVIRDEILDTYPAQVKLFLTEYDASIDYVNQNPAQAAKWIEAAGIVPKAAVAEKALPGCHLVCITGEEMKVLLSGYLQTLFERNPDAVGGGMPDDGFFYTEIWR